MTMPARQKTPKLDRTENEPLHFEHHSTYVKFGATLQLSRCEDQCCGCSRVHCPFCNVHNYKPSRPARVRDHLNQTHFKHALLHKGRSIVIVKCYMQCAVAPGHFHCPYCPKQLLKKAGFLYHMRMHLRKAGKPVSLVQAPNFKQPERILFDGHVIQLCYIQCQGSLGKHYHCPSCGMKSFEDMGPLSDHLWRCREVVGLANQTIIEPDSKKNTEVLWSENILVNVKAPKPKEKFGDQCHISVVRNVSDLPMSRCEEVGCCRRRFHCALCSRSKFKPAYLSHMQEHYLSHWNNRAVCGAYSCLVCYLPCLPKYGMAVYHFHCPKCGVVRRRKSQFITHLEECMGADMERDEELYGVDDTSATMDEPDLTVDEPPGGDEDTGVDNSLDTSVISLEDVTVEEVEPRTIPGVNEVAAVAMETPETSLPKWDIKKVWEVFDTVTANLSTEFLSALEIPSSLEEFLNTIAKEVRVEVISSPGINGSPVYSISGAWENVNLAKHMLRMKLPESLVSSMHGDTNVGHSQDESSTEIEGNMESHQADKNSRQNLEQFGDLTTMDVATPRSRPRNDGQEVMAASLEDVIGISPSNKKTVALKKMTDIKSSHLPSKSGARQHAGRESPKVEKKQANRTLTRSMKNSGSESTLEHDSYKQKGSVEGDYVPSALDMLSSAIEIIHKEEQTQNDEDVHSDMHGISQTVEGEKLSSPPARRGRKRKKKGQGVERDKTPKRRGVNQDSASDQTLPNDIQTPIGKRYSTRGSKVDFSLLATGKKKKEKNKAETDLEKTPKPETDLVPQELTPSVQSSESWTQTIEYVDTSDDYSDLEDLDMEVVSVPASQKLVFSSMAVIPVVTFDMQSISMTKILSKQMTVEANPQLPKMHSCCLCEFEASTFFELVHHCAAEHKMSEDLHCEECLVICLSDDMKKDHIAKCHEKKSVEKDGMHKCSVCTFESTEFSKVTNHMLSSHNSECLRCDVCERVFGKHKSLDIHLSLKHGPRFRAPSRVEKIYTKCRMCPFDGEDFRALSAHLISVHHISNPTRCDVCERVFDKESDLEMHLRKQHGPSEQHVSANRCSICGMLCKSRTNLSRHQIYIHKIQKKSKDDISMECKTCYYTAKTPDDIRKHRLQHKKGILKCHECDTSFSSKSNLQFHMQLHHQKPDIVSCPICAKTFRHKRYIIGHMKRHTGKKKYTCEECGKTFYERCAMKVHQQTHKTSDDREYRYICSYCGKRYNSKSNFNDHMNKHTGEKPYKCDYCEKGFGFRSQLAQHKIFIHSTARPHKCSECNKTFKMATKLQQHMVIHTGVGKHTCEICSRACSSAASLKGHLRKCQLGLLKKPRITIPGVTVEQDVVTAADSILEMAVDSYVIVNSQDNVQDLQQITESHEVQAQQTPVEVYACSVCKREFEDYQDALDHINSAHEESGTDGQTDTVVLSDDSLPHGAVIKIEENAQHGVSMAVGTFDYQQSVIPL